MSRINDKNSVCYFKIIDPQAPKALPGTLTLFGSSEEIERQAANTRATGVLVEEISAEEKARIRRAAECIRRVETLRTFAYSFKGSNNYLIETQCYMVLRAHRSELEALYRHIRYVVKSQCRNTIIVIREHARMAWLRYVRRLSEKEMTDLLDREDEEFLAELQEKYTHDLQ